MQKYFFTGDCCGKGEYNCTNCGKNLYVDEGAKMSICSKCSNTSFKKSFTD